MNKTCCFFGHRKIEDSLELRAKLTKTIKNLITDESIDTFLFGSKSEFNSLCYELVSEIKQKYPHIKRVYVRAEYPYIDERYKNYLLQDYEDTYYPKNVISAGKSVYVERNISMIDKSRICVVYYDSDYAPPMRRVARNVPYAYQPKSGAKIAYEYAVKKNKIIVNLYEKMQVI